jgi:hypothetical protein
MSEAIAVISLAVLLIVVILLLRLYRRRGSGRSLSQDVRIWSKSDRWRHWR